MSGEFKQKNATEAGGRISPLRSPAEREGSMWQELPFLKVTLEKVCLPSGLRPGREWRQSPTLELLAVQGSCRSRGGAGAGVPEP